MTILGCDPGLQCSAAIAYDPTRDEVIGCESWRFGPRAGITDPERILSYSMALAQFLEQWAPIDVFAIEDQQASAVQPTREAGGTFGGRPLPPAVADALRGIGTPGTAIAANPARTRGGKNRSIVRLAKLAGALEQEAERRRIRVVRIQPQQAKRALTGDPKATKHDMRMGAYMAFGYVENEVCGWPDGKPKPPPNEHIADALGIALAARALLRKEALTHARR